MGLHSIHLILFLFERTCQDAEKDSLFFQNLTLSTDDGFLFQNTVNTYVVALDYTNYDFSDFVNAVLPRFSFEFFSGDCRRRHAARSRSTFFRQKKRAGLELLFVCHAG